MNISDLKNGDRVRMAGWDGSTLTGKVSHDRAGNTVLHTDHGVYLICQPALVLEVNGRAVAAQVVTFKDFREQNPELRLEEDDTGGGCRALRLALGENYSVLITACDDPDVPADNATMVCVGHYDDSDGATLSCEEITCDRLSAHLLMLAIKSIL